MPFNKTSLAKTQYKHSRLFLRALYIVLITWAFLFKYILT